MSYSIQTLKNDLQGALHGTQLNQITNLDGVINRAARQLLLDCDPQETKRTMEFISPVFNTVFEYPIAADVKGNRIIDIFPQINRLPKDIWIQAYNQAFDVGKQNIYQSQNMFTMDFNSGIKTLRVNAPYLNPPLTINQVDSLTDNGLWYAGGTATNLAVNNTNFVQGAGSLQFDTTAGAGYIENTTMTPLDMTAHYNQSSLFVWVYIPTAANLTSVNLRWGSSASNYYTSTATQTQGGTAFVNGWNLCEFVWSSSTVVGAPNYKSIGYARVTLNMTGTNTACKVDAINSILGTVLSYEYYSKYLFRNAATGAFQETVTDDSNLINLDTETYNLLFNKVAYFAVQQQQGIDATFYDGTFFENQYQQGLARYKALYKSEVQPPQSTYYKQPDVSNSRFIGRRFNY